MSNKTNPVDAAKPTSGYGPGLSKREYFALEFAKELIRVGWDSPMSNGIIYADIFIKKLNEEKNHENN